MTITFHGLDSSITFIVSIFISISFLHCQEKLSRVCGQLLNGPANTWPLSLQVEAWPQGNTSLCFVLTSLETVLGFRYRLYLPLDRFLD